MTQETLDNQMAPREHAKSNGDTASSSSLVLLNQVNDIRQAGLNGKEQPGNTFSADITQSTAKLRDQVGSNGGGIPDAWSIGQILEDATFLRGDNTLDSNMLNNRLHDFYNDGNPPWYKFWKDSQAPAYAARPHGSDEFYDDNAWIGIAAMDDYYTTHTPADLERAKQLFDFELTGLDGTNDMPHPGGLLWQKGNTDRNTVSNGGAVQLALMLYQDDPYGADAQKYLAFAKQQFEWVDKNLKDPDGLYGDKMMVNGKTENTEWTYNQGLMLGDATMLYQATNDPSYLKSAQNIAEASLHKYAGLDPNGKSGFMNQNPFFDTVFFKNLMILDQVSPNNDYRKALANYAADIDRALKDNGFVYPISSDDSRDNHQTLMQASAIQILSLADENPEK